MATLNQVIKKLRNKKKKKNLKRSFKQPQIKGIVKQVYTRKPKKPNSAIRKVASIRIKGGRQVIAYIPGEGHNLQEHGMVLIRGGRRKDLPGVNHTLIRGKLDLSGVHQRIRARSKYGRKKAVNSF